MSTKTAYRSLLALDLKKIIKYFNFSCSLIMIQENEAWHIKGAKWMNEWMNEA